MNNEWGDDLSIDAIRNFVQFWNTEYPIDYWWRQKYKIAFGSKAHKDQCVLDMRIEFEEDAMIKEELEKSREKKKYSPGRNDWLSERKDTHTISEAQAEDIFDSLDISALREMDKKKKAEGKSGNDIVINR